MTRDDAIASGLITPDCESPRVDLGIPVLRLDDAGHRVARRELEAWVRAGRPLRFFDGPPMRRREER